MKLRCTIILLLLALLQTGGVDGAEKKRKKKGANSEHTDIAASVNTDKKSNDDEDDDGEEEEGAMTYAEKERAHYAMEDMRHSYSVSLPMNRNASGTAWNPDKAPMYKYNLFLGKWLFFFHGDVFGGFNRQDIENMKDLSGKELFLRDRIAFSGHKKSGLDGLFHFNLAVSSDPALANGNGYAQIFQDVNNWNGITQFNHQKPNNYVSEFSVSYAYSFSDHGDVFIYGGYPAEPALGPVAYFKRPSGAFNPDAPLGNSATNSTATTYGVVTGGIRVGKFRLEGSSFTGREPDKRNYDFSLPFFDSRSARLSCNPTSRWSIQVSRGQVKSPGLLYSSVDVVKTNASLSYVYSMGPRSYFAATVLGGMNEVKSRLATHTALAEATWRRKLLITYGRYEWVEKTGDMIGATTLLQLLPGQYNIHALTIGGSRDIFTFKKMFTVAGGAQATACVTDATLNKFFGQYPVSAQVFIHILPALE